MKLNEIRDNKGARKEMTRVGRGVGSGKGRTAGRGTKGQKSRTGVALNGFEGGQMPIFRRLPRRGFNNSLFRPDFTEINLGLLQDAITRGVLDASKPIDAIALMESGLVKNVGDGVKLLGKGKITSKVTLTVTGASKAAVEAVEKAGGSVTVNPIKHVVLEKGKKTSKKEVKKPVAKKTKA